MSLDHRLLFVLFLGLSQWWLGVAFLATGAWSVTSMVLASLWLVCAGLMLVKD